MTYNEIIAKVSRDTGLSPRLVDRTYRSFWRIVRQHITSLPFKENLTDEEFMELRPNVNIPSIGKLNVTLDRYHGMKKYYENSRYDGYRKKHKLGEYAEDKEN